MSYELLASVSEDAINYIAEAVIFDDKGKRIYLKKQDGTPNKKSCMHVLGFNTCIHDFLLGVPSCFFR